jgi:acyl carrier protein
MTTPQPKVATVVSAALAHASGRTPQACGDADLHLETDLGLDSLALLELIERLQAELSITMPDEEIGRLRTVGDLHAAVGRLTDANSQARTHRTTQNPERPRS